MKFDVSVDWVVGYGFWDGVVLGIFDELYSDVGVEGVEGFEL